MGLGIAAIVCACVALLFTGLGFMLTAVPFVGTFLSFGAPVIAIAGIVMGGIGLSQGSKEGQTSFINVVGIALSFLAFIPAVLVAVTCGLCNALCSAATLAPTRDGGYPPPATAPFDDPLYPAPTPEVGDGLVGPPTTEELTEGVEMLNELCGDVWCEGEFDFRFQEITCVDAACTLSFEAKHYTAAEHEPYLTSTVSVAGIEDLVECDSWTLVAGAEICDGRGLSGSWVERMSEALRAWERSFAPSP